jgi:hypothetical protein
LWACWCSGNVTGHITDYVQGAGLLGYYPKVLNGFVSAGYCACGAFCSWVFYSWILVLGCFVSGSSLLAFLFLGIVLSGDWSHDHWIFGVSTWPPTASPPLWLGVLRVFRERVCADN